MKSEKPISLRKLRANRANAQASTGPKTPAGKKRSSLNRVTHGLTSREPVLNVGDCREDPAELEAERRAMAMHFKPEGPIEQFLVDRFTNGQCRLRRFARLERAETEHRKSTAALRFAESSHSSMPTPCGSMIAPRS